MLNSAEYEIFSANKYENAYNSCNYKYFLDLLAGQNSGSAEMSMKKVL